MREGAEGVIRSHQSTDSGYGADVSDDFRAVAARIEANPLGRIMYGQRELFHSNLIGWFFDELPQAADAVFRSFATAGADSDRFVERERKNMDLVFHWPDLAPLIVENKVFSLPQKKQLDGYEAATVTWKHAPALVLLSVSAPGFALGRWQYLSYRDLATRIRAALPDTATYEVETMRRYADLVDDMDRLIDAVEVRSDEERVWLPDSLMSAISSSQMRAALHKARAQRVAGVLNDSLPALERQAASGMTNSQPFVEVFEPITVDGVNLRLGWQLQGDAFRRTAIYQDPPHKGRADIAQRRRVRMSRKHPEFFTFPAQLPQTHAGGNEFNHFAPDSVLKYVKAKDITIAELKTAATAVHAELVALRG